MSIWSVPGLIPIALVCATATGLPPVATSPHSGATSAASRKLVKRADAAARDDKTDEVIALLRQAVTTEPANHDARTALAGVLLEKHPDEALAILTELRDARCRACVRAVTSFVELPNGSTDDAKVRAKLEALASAAHGPPNRSRLPRTRSGRRSSNTNGRCWPPMLATRSASRRPTRRPIRMKRDRSTCRPPACQPLQALRGRAVVGLFL